MKSPHLEDNILSAEVVLVLFAELLNLVYREYEAIAHHDRVSAICSPIGRGWLW
jgi:hypothetical protein